MTKGLAWTFNQVPDAFDRWRPAYVPELYKDLFAYRPIGPSSRVLEVGIGTGQATRPMLETGCTLTAVELGDRLADRAREKFRDFPRFTVVNGAFEDYEAPQGQLDLIYAAASFHWIPEEAGYLKAFRLLRSGGAFARFACHSTYRKGQEALFAAIQEVYAVYMPGSAPAPEYGEADAAERAAIALKYGFADIAFRLYRRTRTYTGQEYAALIGTHSDHIALGEDRCRGLCEGVREAIDRCGGTITLYDTMDLQLARKP
jgi:SAM-dependent methyltransferase